MPKDEKTWQELANKFGQANPLALIIDWYYRRKKLLSDMALDLDVEIWELMDLMGKLDLPIRTRDLPKEGE